MDETKATQAETGGGELVFLVSTARGAIPLEGARVSLSNYVKDDLPNRGDIRFSAISGSDGKTRAVRLFAPPKSDSLRPSALLPYAVYNARIELEGYYTQSYVAIQVFDGVTSVQSVDLVPLPENGRPDSESPDGDRYFETLPNDLSSEGGND